MNIAQLKEKLNVEFEDIEAVYHKAYEKAKGNIDLQVISVYLNVFAQLLKVYMFRLKSINVLETVRSLMGLVQTTRQRRLTH